jgi:MoaA/NifB/PqqE/SkfB family radical SAM enzyme
MVKPKFVIIEVTNRCNLKCQFCPSVSNTTFPRGDMSLEMFKSIIDRIDQTPDWNPTLCPWMLGEPFLNPHYSEMCKYMSKYKMPFYVTTNMMAYQPEALEYLLSPESTCYQIIVSMDGVPGSGNIEKARPGTDEGLLLARAHWLIRKKKEMGSKKDIAVKICDRGQDYGEVEEYIRLWLERGVDYVCVGKRLEYETPVPMRRHPCQFIDHQFMTIRWDGSVILCDYNDTAANDLLWIYGNVGYSGDLLEAYNHPSLRARREAQERGEFSKPCDTCGFAYTGHGLTGEVEFRDWPGQKIYYSADYYNGFYSFVKKWKPREYYTDE